MFNLPLHLPQPKISCSPSSPNSYRRRISNYWLQQLPLPLLQQLLQQLLPPLVPLLPSTLTLVLLTPTLLCTRLRYQRLQHQRLLQINRRQYLQYLQYPRRLLLGLLSPLLFSLLVSLQPTHLLLSLRRLRNLWRLQNIYLRQQLVCYC
jgi:hypothetical protein